MPTAFADKRELTPEELASAPIRYPAPGQLERPLPVSGAKAAQGAASLGLVTIGDLLEHLPRDRREARSVSELIAGETATIIVEVRRIAARPVRRRGMRPLVEAAVADGTGVLSVTFFNQPWLADRYPTGTRLMLHGKVDERGRFTVQGHAPTDAAPTGAVESGTGEGGARPGVAHYPATEGLSSTQILALVQEHAVSFDDVLEPLPAALRLREHLLDRPGALRAAHFPGVEDDHEQARRRLAFDELFFGQLALQQRRRDRRAGARAPRLDGARELTGRWLAQQLPFALTGDQRDAIEVIDADIARGEPMQRLLMGEVGSGKTVVALYTMLRALEHGFQAALMAPTETLADQHFQTIQRLLGAETLSAGLLTGSTPARRRSDLLAKLSTGELSLIVGTHALIEETVRFERLGVVVIDEQHRFGVGQRAALAAGGRGQSHGLTPHELHMTATPIPRTLALSHYGDLDITVLRELPRGRQPIATHLCSTETERERAYTRIREEVDAGRQAFVVCPLVEESEALQARAATSEYERLRAGPFAGYAVVLMHGQMRPADKQAAMERFAAGDGQILVATTVIEVGIDVPNATVMLVEDADRYGISQLHQLRGRIGRGEHASLCLLFGRRESLRLQALARESDGFRLAEVDLALRGHGELAGTRQSGHDVEHRFADLTRDQELLERAALHSRALLDQDPLLAAPEHALMARVLPEDPGVRVVAGTLGGRVLRAPKGSETRPTSDRVREALFSILAAVEDARVLDLFAGSGALGIEALSRGAAQATFVDSAAAAVAAVRQNLADLGLQAEVLKLPALRALACTPVVEREYDLVFLDPPYRMASALGPQLSTALPPILADGARVVVESDRRAPLELDMTLLRERQYGDTLLRVHVAG